MSQRLTDARQARLTAVGDCGGEARHADPPSETHGFLEAEGWINIKQGKRLTPNLHTELGALGQKPHFQSMGIQFPVRSCDKKHD